MADPTSFVNWSDYLGLNEGVGETMANRTLEEADKLEAAARAAADERYRQSRGAGETGDIKAYEAAGEKSRKALASYSEFMQSLKDPAARQALMEKIYGKGRVSKIGSAMMGAQGAGRIAQEQGDFNRAQNYAEDRDIEGGRRLGQYKDLAAKTKAGEAAYQAQRQAEIDAREKNRLGKLYWLQKNRDSRLSDRDNELRMNTITRESGAMNPKTGAVDWDKLDRDWQKSRRTMYDNRPKTFWGGDMDFFNKPKDPSTDTDTWANFYQKQKSGAPKSALDLYDPNKR